MALCSDDVQHERHVPGIAEASGQQVEKGAPEIHGWPIRYQHQRQHDCPGYPVRPDADQANEYHALGVTVDKPGITARTCTGYYAQP
jgi:hypothetical protein